MVVPQNGPVHKNMGVDCVLMIKAVGKGPATKSDDFLEKVPRGGGGGAFSIEKFMLQILGTLNRAF